MLQSCIKGTSSGRRGAEWLRNRAIRALNAWFRYSGRSLTCCMLLGKLAMRACVGLLQLSRSAWLLAQGGASVVVHSNIRCSLVVSVYSRLSVVSLCIHDWTGEWQFMSAHGALSAWRKLDLDSTPTIQGSRGRGTAQLYNPLSRPYSTYSGVANKQASKLDANRRCAYRQSAVKTNALAHRILREWAGVACWLVWRYGSVGDAFVVRSQIATFPLARASFDGQPAQLSRQAVGEDIERRSSMRALRRTPLRLESPNKQTTRRGGDRATELE